VVDLRPLCSSHIPLLAVTTSSTTPAASAGKIFRAHCACSKCVSSNVIDGRESCGLDLLGQRGRRRLLRMCGATLRLGKENRFGNTFENNDLSHIGTPKPGTILTKRYSCCVGDFSLERPGRSDVVLHCTQHSYGSALGSLGAQKNFGYPCPASSAFTVSQSLFRLDFSDLVDQLLQAVSGSNGDNAPVPPNPQCIQVLQDTHRDRAPMSTTGWETHTEKRRSRNFLS